MRDVPWNEVKKFARDRFEASRNQLLGCPLDEVERVRGRAEAYRSLLELENNAPSVRPEDGASFITQ